MFNPGMYPPQGMIPSNSNFVMGYGGAPQNYGGPAYVEPQNMMQRTQTPGFIMKKSYNGPRGGGNYRGGSRDRPRPMHDRRNDRNDRHDRNDNYQKNSDRRYRQEGSYRGDSRDRDDSREDRYDSGKVLPSSKKISKNFSRGPNRRYDGPRPRDDERSPHQGYNPHRPMRRPQPELDDHHKALNSSMFFRTKMCPHLLEGQCTKGPSCSYAHSQEELREAPNLKKTRLCQLFMIGKCNRGNMCSFAHGEEELRATPEFFKTSICNGYLKGNCRSGDHCRYAHGKDELRQGPEGLPEPQIQGYDPYYNYDPHQEYNPYQMQMMPGPGQEMPLVPLGEEQNDPRDPNIVHSHINRTMPMDPNYLNNQSPINQNPGFNKPLDNMPPNVYASNNFPEQSNNMNNPNRKPMGAPQNDYPENIAFNTFNPEKINSLFSSNETGNF